MIGALEGLGCGGGVRIICMVIGGTTSLAIAGALLGLIGGDAKGSVGGAAAGLFGCCVGAYLGGVLL